MVTSNGEPVTSTFRYRIIQSYTGMWTIWDEQNRWVNCTTTLLGAKFCAKRHAAKRRRPVKPPKITDFTYEV